MLLQKRNQKKVVAENAFFLAGSPKYILYIYHVYILERKDTQQCFTPDFLNLDIFFYTKSFKNWQGGEMIINSTKITNHPPHVLNLMFIYCIFMYLY